MAGKKHTKMNSGKHIKSLESSKKSKGKKSRVKNTDENATLTKRLSNGRRTFPKNTIEEARKIASVIEEKNGGKPWASDEVAAACGTTKGSPKFFYLSSSSRDYGLTEGTRDTATISITELGRAIISPASLDERLKGLQAAFHNVALFRKTDEHYGNKSLPEDHFFDSFVQKNFALTKEQTKEFRTIFKQNRDYLAQQGVKFKSAERERVSPNDTQIPPEFDVIVSTHAREAFVIMPFGEKGKEPRPSGFFKQVLKQIIKPAGDAAKFNIITAMQQGSDVIQSTIIKYLLKADLVIADLTDHNPNVLFELGVRIAIDKPVILIRAEGTSGIFDVDNVMRVESYNPLLWPDTVKEDVAKMTNHIADGWKRKDNDRRYMEILAGEGWHQLAGYPSISS